MVKIQRRISDIIFILNNPQRIRCGEPYSDNDGNDDDDNKNNNNNYTIACSIALILSKTKTKKFNFFDFKIGTLTLDEIWFGGSR